MIIDEHKQNMTKEKGIAKPFLKWAGGKRWLVNYYNQYIHYENERYIEPFLGSGAMFFNIQPQDAIISDTNEELMITYKAIKENWKKVYDQLVYYHEYHTKDLYYEIRSKSYIDVYDRAARFIYLNRTCWNGLYRVNKKGYFNVPIGTRKNVIFSDDNFKLASDILKRAHIECLDFEEIIGASEKNDFLFVDPPYTVRHNNNSFIKYNEKLFSWHDQLRLHKCLLNAKRRGAKIVALNANHKDIINLYKEDFEIVVLKRFSGLAADYSKRNMCTEIVIKS